MKEYYFYIQIGPTWTQFVPLKNWSFTRANETIRPVTSISDLSFINAEFDTLHTQSKTKSVLNIRLYENTTLVWSGEITLSGSYDFDNKLCTLKLSENTTNIYRIIEKLNPEVNLLENLTRRNSKLSDIPVKNWILDYSILTVDEKSVCFQDYTPNNPYSPTKTYKNSSTYKNIEYFATADYFCYYDGYFYLSLADANIGNTPFAGSEYWILYADYDFGSDILQHYTYISEIKAHGIPFTYLPIFLGTGGTELILQFDNGRLLFDVIYKLVGALQNGVLITSTPGVNCWCELFESNELYKYIRLYQITDIIRYNAEFPATICMYKFLDFMNVLKNVFGLDWFINANGYFQLVKSTDVIFQNVSFDLASIQSTRDKYGYTKKEDKQVSTEKFLFMDAPTTFDRVLVDYMQNGEAQSTENSNVYNNVAFAILNEELNTTGISFVLVDNLDFILKSGDVYNYLMSSEQLFRTFLTTNRPAKQGYINSELITLTDNDNLELKEITTKADPIDFFNIDMNGLCKTGFETVLGKSGFRIKKLQKTFDNRLIINLSL